MAAAAAADNMQGVRADGEATPHGCLLANAAADLVYFAIAADDCCRAAIGCRSHGPVQAMTVKSIWSVICSVTVVPFNEESV